MTSAAGPVAVLDREARSLVLRLRVWTPARWAAATEAGPSRADVAHHLAQVLADLAPTTDPARPARLPRLDDDLVLPDQLAVTADDLVRSGPDDATAREATAHLLLHRADLLGDAPPAGLVADLGLDEDDPLAQPRRACRLHAP